MLLKSYQKLTIPLLLSPKEGVFPKDWQTTSEASLSSVIHSYLISKTIQASLLSLQTLVLLLFSSYQKWKEKIKNTLSIYYEGIHSSFPFFYWRTLVRFLRT